MFKKISYLVIGLIISAFLMASCASSSKKELSKKERAQLLIEIANGALSEGDPIGALERLLEAEKLEPDLPELHHSKALAFFAKRDFKTALAEARKATVLMPVYSDANNTLGKLLLDGGEYKEAEDFLSKAANDHLYRDAYKAHTNLGILYYRQARFSKSSFHFDKAIESAPSVACVAYYYKGHLHMAESKLIQATRDYEHATRKFCASFGDAHLALGIAYTRNKQYDLARKKFLEIKQRFPETKLADQAMDHLRYLP